MLHIDRHHVRHQADDFGELPRRIRLSQLQQLTSAGVDPFKAFLQFFDHFGSLSQTSLTSRVVGQLFSNLSQFGFVLIERLSSIGQRGIARFGFRLESLLFFLKRFERVLIIRHRAGQLLDFARVTIFLADRNFQLRIGGAYRAADLRNQGHQF